ncbi:hypothetical protein WJX84_003342 [Apatococcus fuscideae]|uniref:Uncharacterized protein n=1 Tax=Apatococcus fuscideae TaxID=2026836 RepID=A0AAW1THD4_9CHLO
MRSAGAARHLTASQGSRRAARSWHGQEDWLPFPEFSNMLHSPPLHSLLNCDQWQAVSPLVFPSTTRETKAVQAIEICTSQQRQLGDQPPAEQHPHAVAPQQTRSPPSDQRRLTFTFCLERVEVGPYKGCWLTVGVRAGNYA